MNNKTQEMQILVGFKEKESFSFDSLFEIHLPEGSVSNCHFKVEANVRKAGDVFCVEASVEGTVHAQCHRCLEMFDMPVKTGFSMIFHRGSAVEQSEDVLEDDFILLTEEGENRYDIFPRVTEAIILEIPIKILCKPDCKGLCPVCGANLNEGDCGCDRSETDPRWDALKKLVNGGHKG